MKLEPQERLEGDQIYLQKPEETFEFAKKMFDVVDANKDHIFPWMDWALPEITRLFLKLTDFCLINWTCRRIQARMGLQTERI